MKNIDLTPVFELLIAVISLLITSFLIPYIKKEERKVSL